MDKPSKLLDCPSEILCHIIDCVTDGDLSTLRLTCKQFSACALKPFALAHFTERKHIVSRDSITTLWRITAHPVFGRYVNAVIIYAPMLYKALPFYHSSTFKDLLMMIFENIKNSNGAVVVGLSDRHPRDSFRSDRYKDRIESRDPYEAAELFGKALSSAKQVACPVRGVKLDLHREEYQTITQLVGRGVACPLLNSFSAGLSSLTSPDFELVLGPDERRLKYTSRDSAMTISESPYVNLNTCPDIQRNFDVMCYTWSSTVHVTRLCLQDCNFTGVRDVEQLIRHNAHVLISVELNYCEVEPIGSNLDVWFRWSEVFKQLSNIVSLRHCKLGELRYGPDADEEQQLDCDKNTFTLQYPNGEEKFELEGTDISAQLQNLSAWTASQEEAASAKWIKSHITHSDTE